jgi:hypothetical protein
MPRDMTRKQFESACARRGFKRECLGYFRITENVCVYARNGGDKRRDQLAYMIQQEKKEKKKS